MTDVNVVGGVNIDISGKSFDALRDGVSVPGRVLRSLGGAGRNVAANLARLGLTVALYSRVGADADGAHALTRTKAAGVRVDYVGRNAERSDAYVSLLGGSGELAAAVADMTAAESIDDGQIERWLPSLFDCRLAVVDTNLHADTLTNLIHRFRSAGIYCIVQISSAEKAERLGGLSGKADLIVCNRKEADALAAALASPAGESWEAVSLVTEALCVTAGAAELTLYDEHGATRLSPYAVNTVIDTTGAGDALTAGIAFGLFRAFSLEKSARYGLAAAAIALQSEGADSESMNRHALESWA